MKNLKAHRKKNLKERFREESAREILVAAEDVFGEHGLNAAAMSHIAERAGVAVGTLYNRFKDRESLVAVLLETRRCELLENLDLELAASESAPFQAQLLGFLRTWFDLFERHRPFLRVIFANERDLEKKRQMSRALIERIQLLLSRAPRSLGLRKDPEQNLPVALLSLARGVLWREDLGLPALDPEQAARAVVDLFLKGAGR